MFFPCFLLRRKSIPNGVQTQQNFLEIFYGPEGTTWAEEVPEGCPEGAQPTWARLGVVPTLVASRTASLLYKYPENPKTLGELTKHYSIRRKFQKHQIQSRHHHGGVHHPHWCLSDDA
jgi:hypothetical protein